MRQIGRAAILCSAASLFALFAHAQDSQSLGDAARQARQQKEAKASQSQSEDAAATSKIPRVITNDELPQSSEPAPKIHPAVWTDAAKPQEHPREQGKMSAAQWKSQIGAQKFQIRYLQSQIDRLSESIRFVPANCVANCVHWNERQRAKQQQVDQLKSQMEDQKKRLDDMQEQARQQGYGSSVYEPD